MQNKYVYILLLFLFQLRNILEDKVYDLFQRKLRDEVLTKDPNFHWCSQVYNINRIVIVLNIKA